ncbi:DUF5954 family protein [Streptomyces sp. PAN_FS17]|uniref:DUF5954 family protein n=1 Tax=Streptomyces sp. PAN_FS17 TaxID=1855351 RepID=UPI0008978EDF|nr:DUF5954 family protein [Streptomyces sp. PAN_FS17]SED39239.1 hypothetical protein SAMN05216482_7241 [Streptomyces sp. PAN_FS17]
MTHDRQQQIHALHEELVHRDDPAARVREADAVDASVRYPGFALRGPVFGVAVRDPAAGPRWRLLKPVVNGMPQMCRDSLNTHLWFRAKDGTDAPGVRRELLAAVAVLNREPVNEVEATPHDARPVLHDAMAEMWPLLFRFDDAKRAVYRRAAEDFRALEQADEARVDGRVFRICRVERVPRMGPDGPEPARPSDMDEYGPMKIHPTLLPDGTVVFDD